MMIGISAAQTRAELEKQREKLTREIAELQNTVKEIAKEKSLTQQQVTALSKQINLREQKINTITSEVAVINKHINANTAAVNKLKAELEKMKRDYEKMVMFAFRNRNAYNKLMFIFASKDFNQGFRRVKYLQQFNDSRKLKAADIENTKKQIEQKIAQLQADRNKQVALMKEQETEKRTISQQRSVYSGQLSDLIVTERGVKKDITQKKKKNVGSMLLSKKSLEERLKLKEDVQKLLVVLPKQPQNVIGKQMNLQMLRKVKTVRVQKVVIPHGKQILRSYAAHRKRSSFQMILDLIEVACLGRFRMRKLCKVLVVKA
ncbi:hypothetical protein KUH03_25030 [Sphingobacterium sp. E70]|uniref:murein hydrolase activator EnvC family protein n=1 Tax=Sphingobacterium sp. E70 TaxID=2853439 RepID=UPI00211CC8F5|nr:hypothetical protein [Sphingobacterium sp. E70]ULT22612.1 hypothetical protein KUH03_25030 [Sphingobacterium sp. E70]